MGKLRTPSDGLKVFVSYSRHDLQAADELVTLLEANGFEVKIDRRDLPYGEEWQSELGDFIRGCDTVVWLVTPDSIASRWVNWELGELARLSKRLIPVRIREIDVSKLPEALGKIHILPAEGLFDGNRHTPLLVQALNSDGAWLKEATRLGDRARQWLGKGKDAGSLLRGRALTDAEVWSRRRPRSAPPISSDILELILNSRRATVQQQRRTVAVSLALAAFGIGLALFSWTQRNAALTNQSTYLANLAQDQIAAGDAATGLLLAVSALPRMPFDVDRPRVHEATRSLYDALYALREVRTFSGHDNDVNTVRFSPDGQTVLTSSDDGTAGLWDVASGKRLQTYGPHKGKVYAAQFSPDGSRVVTTGDDNALYLWDTATGGRRATLAAHQDRIVAARFSPSGERLITGSRDKTARIWDVATAQVSAVLAGHGDQLTSTSFSPDGRRVLTSSNDKLAIIWDGETAAELLRLAHPAPVLGAVFDATGVRVATFGQDQSARVWDAANGQELAVLAVPGAPLSAVEFCGPNCVMTASWDGLLRLWDVAKARVIFELKGHSETILKVLADPSGRFAVTVSRDGTTVVWEISTGSKALILGGHGADIFDAAFSADGRYLLTASRDRTARMWQIPAPLTTQAFANFGMSFRSIDVSSNGKMIALGGYEGDVRLVDRTTLKPLADAKLGPAAVSYLGFDRGSRRLVAGSGDGRLRILDVPSLKATFESATDGTEIGGGGFTGEYPEVTVATVGGSRADFNGQTLKLQQARWSADAKTDLVSVPSPALDRVAVGELNGRVRIVDSGSGQLVAELKGHRGAVLGAAFDPTGRLLVTGSEDATARLWDPATGAQLKVLSGHTRPVGSVAVSDDGGYVATASGDHTVRIWKVGEEPSLVAIYRGHLAPVDLVRFAGGLRIVSAANDGAVHSWDFAARPAALRNVAKVVAPRCYDEGQLASFGLKKSRPRWCRVLPAVATVAGNDAVAKGGKSTTDGGQ